MYIKLAMVGGGVLSARHLAAMASSAGRVGMSGPVGVKVVSMGILLRG
jgi:hypothetical protein